MTLDLGDDPYYRLGLRHNPFVGDEQVEWATSIWVDRGWSQAPSPQAKQVIQVIGDKGFGKTSHLKHWQSQASGPYCYYPPGIGRFKLPPISAIAYWDEADRIPIPILSLALMRASVAHSTIVLGTHCDRSSIAQKLGLSVVTIELLPLDIETLLSWSDARIQATRLLDQPCRLVLSTPKAKDIILKSKGSWQSAADYLHIWAAEEGAKHVP